MAKRAPYFSWGMTEQAQLVVATHDEVVLYLTILKPLADFRSGLVGTFAKRPLTLTRLGELMSRPATQGRPAVNYDGTEARRILERLAARGLVADLTHVGGALVLRLPLSPIGASAKVAKLSGTPEASALASPSVNELPEDFTEPAPVLANTGQSRQGKTTDHTEAGWASHPPIPGLEGEADPTPQPDPSSPTPDPTPTQRLPLYLRGESEYSGFSGRGKVAL